MEKSSLHADGSTTNNTGVAIETSLQTDTGTAIDAKQEPVKDVAVAEVKPEPPEPEKKKKRTVGNIIYDFGVFGSIAWGGVALLSAVSAHEAMHGNNRAFGWLRSLNDNVFGWLKKNLSKTILKGASSDTVKGYAKGTTMFLTLGMGGNALMAPIKWLEDNRQSNAAKIDNALGTTPPDPDTIAHEPKQTWKSVFTGRMVSWGTSYAAFLAMGPRITGNISDWFGEKATKGWLKLRPNSDKLKVRKWADIAAFDALFTVITAAITYMMSRYVAKKDDQGPDAHDVLYAINTAVPVSDPAYYQYSSANPNLSTVRDLAAMKEGTELARLEMNASPASPVIGERKFADLQGGLITEKLAQQSAAEQTQPQI